MKSINFWFLVFSTGGFLFFVKFANFFMPGRYYFTFTSFLLEDGRTDSFWALTIKLALPFIFSLLLATFLNWIYKFTPATSSQKSGFQVLLQDQLSSTLSAGAALAALLLAWPYILLWDILIDPIHYDQRLVFYVSYLAYVVAYYLLARAGCQIAAIRRQSVELGVAKATK